MIVDASMAVAAQRQRHEMDSMESSLREGITLISQGEHRAVSFESLYRAAYLMCIHKRHDRIVRVVSEGLLEAALKTLQDHASISLDRSRYDTMCVMIKDLLLFYNNRRPQNMPSFEEMADEGWTGAITQLPRRVLRERRV